MKKSKGYHTRTRRLFKKGLRERGKKRVSALLHEYQSGHQVVIKIDSSTQKGMPHRRYYGKIGTVVEKRGRSYIIKVANGNAHKNIIVRPEHLYPTKR
jgi:large subunit ribosomal protein L21e